MLVDENKIFDAVNIAVLNAFRDTGYKPLSENEHQYLVNGITDYIIDKMPNFIPENINKAFENGILREYGDYHGLSKVSFVSFLKSYSLATAAPKTNKQIEMIKSKPLLPEQFDTAAGNAVDAYNTWVAYKQGKSTRDIQRAASMNYDFLKSLGLIIYSTEVRQEIWKDAIVRAVKTANDKKANSDLFLRQALDILKERYQAIPDENSKEFKDIKNEAKYITLCKYFDDIILSKTNFGELVESKREVFYNLKSK